MIKKSPYLSLKTAYIFFKRQLSIGYLKMYEFCQGKSEFQNNFISKQFPFFKQFIMLR